MIKLASNGNKGTGDAWCGRDPASIVYPHVSSCITVTCVARGQLAGAHLSIYPTREETDADLAVFAPLAAGASAMYVIGVLEGWSAQRRNRTGLHYQGLGGGSLIARLREAVGYDGVVQTCDTSAFSSEVKLTASLAGDVATFTWRRHGEPAVQPVIGFQSIAGTVMFAAPAGGDGGCVGCVIL